MAARDVELSELIASRNADIVNYEGKLESQAKESQDADAAIKEQSARAAEEEAKAGGISSQRAERNERRAKK